jgi:hypothetical protein
MADFRHEAFQGIGGLGIRDSRSQDKLQIALAAFLLQIHDEGVQRDEGRRCGRNGWLHGRRGFGRDLPACQFVLLLQQQPYHHPGRDQHDHEDGDQDQDQCLARLLAAGSGKGMCGGVRDGQFNSPVCQRGLSSIARFPQCMNNGVLMR